VRRPSTRARSSHCDLFLVLGTDYPYSVFLPRKSAVIQVVLDVVADAKRRDAPVSAAECL
jgi:thiamine pyrophosphate-dependent acetolactate synthase large subunit-like protein